jgi:calcium permeable stress-gated cation channel
MLSTLVPALSISVACLVIFLLLRRSHRRLYAPRTFLGSLQHDERSPELPNGWFNWLHTFWTIPDTYALQHQSLDAYLFLRFLRVCTTMAFVCLVITWSVLFPVHATASNGKSQLERISYSNINIETEANRLYAHTFVGWTAYGFVMYAITRECIFYITLRQAFLLSPAQAERISSRTVLFTAVPDDLLSEAALLEVFGEERVKRIWIVGDTASLDKLVEERDETAILLEKSLVTFLKAVHTSDSENELQRKKDARPRHRLGPMGLAGRSVDTIDWARDRLKELIPDTKAKQDGYLAGDFKKRHSVFIEFASQAEAQAAFQFVAHHQALHMAPRFIGIKPKEVIWANLDIPWWQRIIRHYVVYFLTAVLIIFWGIPVGIVGMIAQVDVLKQVRGLAWIGDIPDVSVDTSPTVAHQPCSDMAIPRRSLALSLASSPPLPLPFS